MVTKTRHPVKGDRLAKQLIKAKGGPLTSQEMKILDCEARRQEFMGFYAKFNGNIAAACIATGISRRTFQKWVQTYPEFAAPLEEVNDAIIDLAEQQLMKNIQAGKEQSLFFLLCNKGKKRGWQDPRKLQPVRDGGVRINIVYPDEKTKPIQVIDVTPKEIKSLPDVKDDPNGNESGQTGDTVPANE